MKKIFLSLAAAAFLLSMSVACSSGSDSKSTPDVEETDGAFTDDAEESTTIISEEYDGEEFVGEPDSDEDYDAEETASSSSSSEDWDALLNSYEEYVDKYITYAKKAAQGDMSALAEYPALMSKAQEFSTKISSATSEMSASQLARYTQITQKMADAARSLQQ